MFSKLFILNTYCFNTVQNFENICKNTKQNDRNWVKNEPERPTPDQKRTKTIQTGSKMNQNDPNLIKNEPN